MVTHFVLMFKHHHILTGYIFDHKDLCIFKMQDLSAAIIANLCCIEHLPK